MGNTSELFKKIRDNKGTFHAKMGSIKDRNGMDLTNSRQRKRSERQRKKRKIYLVECKVPKNSKERLKKPSSAINAKK